MRAAVGAARTMEAIQMRTVTFRARPTEDSQIVRIG